MNFKKRLKRERIGFFLAMLTIITGIPAGVWITLKFSNVFLQVGICVVCGIITSVVVLSINDCINAEQ